MKITLKERKLSSGKISLVIEYYKGSEVSEEGKRKHIRDFENLKIYLHDNPKSVNEKKENKEALILAKKILAIREAEYYQGKFDIKNSAKSKQSFLNYFSEKTEEKIDSPKNYGNWSATLIHLRRCISPNLTFAEINEDFIKKIRKYFDREAKTKSNTLLSQNSKYSYFNKVKACLRVAFDEGYISINYASKVKAFEQGESQREYLTYNELQRLANCDCKYPVLKNAFIFSCLTGLRWSDINTLLWSEVREENQNSEEIIKINFRQEKTAAVEYLYISKQARDLLGKRTNESLRVFIGLKYSAVYNTELLRWCNRAGITKHITFHSARHTNAVLLLENGADIYTVSKRLGHSELATTQIYAKMVDQKNKAAADLIPLIKFDL